MIYKLKKIIFEHLLQVPCSTDVILSPVLLGIRLAEKNVLFSVQKTASTKMCIVQVTSC